MADEDKPWREAPSEDKGLEVDALIEVLGDNVAEPPDAFVVAGLVGKAPTEKTWRIYLNYALSEFFEVHERYVIYAATTDDDRTRVWIESGAPMRHVVRRPTRAERISYAPNRAGGGRQGYDGYYVSGPFAEWADDLGEPDVEGEPVISGCSCKPKKTN